jgi:hypothetical protein
VPPGGVTAVTLGSPPRAAAVAVALATAGCSVVLMEKPPDQVGDPYPVCSESLGAPLTDVAIAALGALVAYGIWQDHQQSDEPIPEDDRNAMIAFGSLAAVHATSSAFGFHWASRCAARRSEWEAAHLRYGHPSDLRPSLTSPSPGPPPARGIAGRPCYPNGTCNAGLTCDLATTTCTAAPQPPPPGPPPPSPPPSPPPAD